ncbi:hypothetical protein EUGRSUZ_B01384 [Eucalyptus grandis]|uniref:eRF1 domain-containing protein n=2 Tax=Eucalyptus grandis TaxID=71139 RepID=A0A059D253_EUCGR|nr:hypothetical protein EUGRSUZ_B01384 [Eucalyptus grandis]
MTRPGHAMDLSMWRWPMIEWLSRHLITDDLFRNADVATRRKYVNLVNSVKNSGGTAHVFSSMHVSGEQLAQLTGIAAILRFPLPDLDDIEM